MRIATLLLPLLAACSTEVEEPPVAEDVDEAGTAENEPEITPEPEPEPEPEPAPEPVAETGPEVRPEGSADAAPKERTQVEALEAYWGQVWGGMILRYQRAGVDLDGPATFPPWEEVEEGLRARVVPDADEQERMILRHAEWPATATATRVGGMLGRETLEPAELERALEAAAAHAVEIDAQARIFVDMLTNAREQLWEAGNYSAAPLIGIPPASRGEVVLDSGLVQYERWTVYWRVWADEFPWIVEQRDLLKERVRERLAAMQAAVEGG